MPNKLTQEEFIAKSRAVHGDRYDYSLAIYRGQAIPVTIVCRLHGPFQQTPVHHHLMGRGCPVCAIAQRAQTNRARSAARRASAPK